MTPRTARLSAVVLCACGGGDHSAPGLVFEKRTLDAAYRSEGVAVFDVDKDGHLDIVTDQFWYAGPSLVPHEIRTPQTFDPATEFCQSFAVIPWDLNADGYLDIVVAPHVNGDEMLWYENPKGADAHWTAHVLAPQNTVGLETPIAVDLFGNGTPVLLSSDSLTDALVWQTPGADPTALWPATIVVGPGFPGAGLAVHGIGAGDVDGDGRTDVLTGYGWAGATADPSSWTWHPFAFGPDDCSRMFAYDVDGDGLADVFCAHPHAYGFHAWLQQPRGTAGGRDLAFVDVVVDDTLSQMHALRLDDLDGDGTPELVSGKRWWAHGPNGDPGVGDPALLVYYSMKRAGRHATFERHTIDRDSGVGTQFEIKDVDGDGKVDIVVSNKKGLFYFHQR